MLPVKCPVVYHGLHSYIHKEYLYSAKNQVTRRCIVVQHHINGDHAFLWETAKSDPHESKLLTHWNETVNMICPNIKFGNKLINGGFWGDGRNITPLHFCIYRPFSRHRRIFTCCNSKRWNHAGMCLLGVIKLTLISYSYFIPKTKEIWSKTVLIFPVVTLNNGHAYK